jgi:dTDP-4-amino-4,6-dideoxygalactose transaminase
MTRGEFILGGEVKRFEGEYAAYSQTKHCLGVSNGYDALKISLRALDIGPGDEVIVPAHTYIASIFAVLEVGAIPVLAEPDIHTYNITESDVASVMTKNTKAIMPVHLYGQPCAMDGIMNLANRHSVYVIEDNAQAQGARYKGRRTGSFGQISATSFYPAKNLGAIGDAGAITTDDDRLAELSHILRNVGSANKYHHEILGYNARLDEIQAAMLSCKRPHLDEWNKERRRIAQRYIQNLKDCHSVILPMQIEEVEHVFHLFVIRTRQRDQLKNYLLSHDIQSLIHYPIPPHLQPALKHLGYGRGDFPCAEEISDTCLSLPLYLGISDDQIDFVSEKIIAFAG